METEDYIQLLVVVIGISLILLTALAVKIFKAKFIYHDSRCIFADCRIIK